MVLSRYSGGARKKQSAKKRSVRRAVGKAAKDARRVLKRTASRGVGVVGDVVGAAGQVAKGAVGIGKGAVRTGIDLIQPIVPSVQGKKILVNSGGKRTRKKRKSKKRSKAGMMSDLDDLTRAFGRVALLPVDAAQSAAALTSRTVPSVFAFPGGPGPAIVMGAAPALPAQLVTMGSKSKGRGPKGARRMSVDARQGTRASARSNKGVKAASYKPATVGKKRTVSKQSIAKAKRTRARTKAKGFKNVAAMRSAAAKRGRATATANKELNALFGNLGL